MEGWRDRRREEESEIKQKRREEERWGRDSKRETQKEKEAGTEGR